MASNVLYTVYIKLVISGNSGILCYLWLFYLFHFIWQWALFVVSVPPCYFGCSNKYSPVELVDSQLPHYVRNCIACLPPSLSLSLYIFNSLYLSYLPVMNFYALSLTFIVFISAFSLSFSLSLSLVCVWLCLMCIWVFCKHFNKFKSFVAFILIMRI